MWLEAIDHPGVALLLAYDRNGSLRIAQQCQSDISLHEQVVSLASFCASHLSNEEGVHAFNAALNACRFMDQGEATRLLCSVLQLPNGTPPPRVLTGQERALLRAAAPLLASDTGAGVLALVASDPNHRGLVNSSSIAENPVFCRVRFRLDLATETVTVTTSARSRENNGGWVDHDHRYSIGQFVVTVLATIT